MRNKTTLILLIFLLVLTFLPQENVRTYNPSKELLARLTYA